MERYELAKNRIMELETETDGAFGDYIKEAAHLFVTIFHVMDGTEDAKQRKEWTGSLYEEIVGDNYETSYANPVYCVKKFGEKTGQYLCWFYARFRDSIVAAFEEDRRRSNKMHGVVFAGGFCIIFGGGNRALPERDNLLRCS